MKLRIEIDCDNAAFDRVPEVEVCRILGYTINMLTNGAKDKKLYDASGNHVGRVWYEDER